MRRSISVEELLSFLDGGELVEAFDVDQGFGHGGTEQLAVDLEGATVGAFGAPLVGVEVEGDVDTGSAQVVGPPVGGGHGVAPVGQEPVEVVVTTQVLHKGEDGGLGVGGGRDQGDAFAQVGDAVLVWGAGADQGVDGVAEQVVFGAGFGFVLVADVVGVGVGGGPAACRRWWLRSGCEPQLSNMGRNVATEPEGESMQARGSVAQGRGGGAAPQVGWLLWLGAGLVTGLVACTLLWLGSEQMTHAENMGVHTLRLPQWTWFLAAQLLFVIAGAVVVGVVLSARRGSFGHRMGLLAGAVLSPLVVLVAPYVIVVSRSRTIGEQLLRWGLLSDRLQVGAGLVLGTLMTVIIWTLVGARRGPGVTS